MIRSLVRPAQRRDGRQERQRVYGDVKLVKQSLGRCRVRAWSHLRYVTSKSL